MGSSSLKTTLTSVMPSLRSFLRMILASGSMFVLLMSATRKAVGSILLAAPIDDMILTPRRLQRRMSSSLAVTVSMQSTT